MMRCRKNGERGATIIEFAFVAMIFFLIMWGIFEFGRAFYVRNSTQHLTRCIARAAVIRVPNQDGAEAAIKECLIQKGNTADYFWPFYNLTADDMKDDVFDVRYCYYPDGTETCGSSIPTEPIDEVFECGITSRCSVEVSVPDEKLEMFGMFVGLLASPKEIEEPDARTKMPAESFGFLPPASP